MLYLVFREESSRTNHFRYSLALVIFAAFLVSILLGHETVEAYNIGQTFSRPYT